MKAIDNLKVGNTFLLNSFIGWNGNKDKSITNTFCLSLPYQAQVVEITHSHLYGNTPTYYITDNNGYSWAVDNNYYKGKDQIINLSK